MANYGAAWFMVALSAVLIAGVIRLEEAELVERFGGRKLSSSTADRTGVLKMENRNNSRRLYFRWPEK